MHKHRPYIYKGHTLRAVNPELINSVIKSRCCLFVFISELFASEYSFFYEISNVKKSSGGVELIM